MESDRKIGLTSSGIDYISVLIYVVLVLMGWLSIYAAVYNDDHRSVFDLSQRYGVQIVWIGISFMLAISILLIDGRYYHMFAYPLYWVGLIVMMGVMMFGKEVNGARSWIGIGSVGIQPVEFMKIVTALALARFMSSYNFNIKERRALFYVGAIILMPVMLILLQNDTGSALVFSAFLIILYREGFGKALYIIFGFFVFLGVMSFYLEPLTLVMIIVAVCVGCETINSRNYSHGVRYMGLLVGLFILVEIVRGMLGYQSNGAISLVWAAVFSLPAVAVYAVHRNARSVWLYVTLFVAAVSFVFVVDYAFDNILQTHQQKRILDLLGIENDPQGWGYNSLQSKIAIGSGGVWGKGFLQGTQTRFSFVPEQSTDFIFCTVGEEWGFIGSIVVVLLFAALIFRLMRMGERQKEPFARIYCYSVAAILFMHFFINISMAIGIFPIVGIPLPFFSYGGSSLLAFTILLFIAIRLDSSQWEGQSRKLL